VTEKIYDNPLHPYTRMIMASVPRLDRKWADVEIRLRGQQSALTDGCVYYARCPLAGKTGECDRHSPPLIEVERDHWVACALHRRGG
jgi:peptide/nickel transport system ATP-binding protein